MKTGFDSNNGQPETTMGAAMSAAQQQAVPPQDNTRRQPVGGMRSVMGRNAAPMSRQQSSEILNQLHKILTDEYASVPGLKPYNVELIPLPYQETSNIHVSSILVALSEKGKEDQGVAYHALVLAGDSAQAAERTENWNNATYDIDQATGDLVDQVMTGYYADIMRKRFPQSTIYYADAEVVPRDFNITDKSVIRSLSSNAIIACFTELDTRRPDFQYPNMALVGKDNTLQVRTTHNMPEISDAQGFPVRADIQVDFRSVPNQPSGGVFGTQNTDRVEEYSMASAFVNLAYDPVIVQSNQWMPQAPRNPNETQMYSAQLVLTQLVSNEEINNATQLLALSTVFPLLDQSQPWLQNFLPAHLAPTAFSARRSGFDPRDIGALNYEARLPDAAGNVDRINTTDPQTFDERAFYALTQTLIRAGIALSMDIPECGDSTWYNRFFMAARDINSGAYRALVAAADALTNNNFSKHFAKTSGQILNNTEDRIHMGYFVDSEGVKHDLRTIDLLYMLNKFGKDDPTVGRQWTETFMNGRPMWVNLAIRRKMIEACVGNVVFTGFARRITFHGEFIRALDIAIAETGLQVKAVTSGQGSGWAQRGSANLAGSGALVTGFNSGFAGMNYGGNQQTYGGYRPGYTPQRW